MKTKIIKNPGWWKLVVQDEAINQQYNCSNENPIVLGIITNFFESGCWSVQDYRNKKTLRPSPYLEESVQEYLPKNDLEREVILSSVYRPQVDERGVIAWALFDSYLFDGNNQDCRDSRGFQYSSVARFTFSEASKRLSEQKAFWTNFTKDDLTLDEVRIENPYRQISSSDFSFLSFMQKQILKEQDDQVTKKMKP